MARFRNYFLTGLVVAGPVAITLYLTWWFVTWVDGLVRPFVPIAYRPETYLPFGLPGSGLIVAVVALTLLGFLTANLIGRTLVDLGDRLLGRIPAVRAIYRGLKQVFETLFSGQGSSFRRVGLVEFPSPGMWSIVLISQAPSVDVARSLPGQEDHISVFLPCAPNPTTGFFFYVPKSKIIEVDMSTEDAATLIMSCGVVQPGSATIRRRRRPRSPAWRTPRASPMPRPAARAREGGIAWPKARAFRERVHETRKDVSMITPEEAKRRLDAGGVLLIDVGEEWQLRERGTIRRRAQHHPRRARNQSRYAGGAPRSWLAGPRAKNHFDLWRRRQGHVVGRGSAGDGIYGRLGDPGRLPRLAEGGLCRSEPYPAPISGMASSRSNK